MICYCKRDIADGARRVTLELSMDWGNSDLREPAPPKRYLFCSFACVSQWAQDRALAHDGVVVTEGVPGAAS